MTLGTIIIIAILAVMAHEIQSLRNKIEDQATDYEEDIY